MTTFDKPEDDKQQVEQHDPDNYLLENLYPASYSSDSLELTQKSAQDILPAGFPESSKFTEDLTPPGNTSNREGKEHTLEGESPQGERVDPKVAELQNFFKNLIKMPTLAQEIAKNPALLKELTTVQQLLKDLGNDLFEIRQRASAQLRDFLNKNLAKDQPSLALQVILKTAKNENTDPEVASRIKQELAAIWSASQVEEKGKLLTHSEPTVRQWAKEALPTSEKFLADLVSLGSLASSSHNKPLQDALRSVAKEYRDDLGVELFKAPLVEIVDSLEDLKDTVANLKVGELNQADKDEAIKQLLATTETLIQNTERTAARDTSILARMLYPEGTRGTALKEEKALAQPGQPGLLNRAANAAGVAMLAGAFARVFGGGNPPGNAPLEQRTRLFLREASFSTGEQFAAAPGLLRLDIANTFVDLAAKLKESGQDQARVDQLQALATRYLKEGLAYVPEVRQFSNFTGLLDRLRSLNSTRFNQLIPDKVQGAK